MASVEEIAVLILEAGACQDCGCPLRDLDEARRHAEGGEACDDWNEGPGRNRITILDPDGSPDGSYALLAINDDHPATHWVDDPTEDPAMHWTDYLRPDERALLPEMSPDWAGGVSDTVVLLLRIARLRAEVEFVGNKLAETYADEEPRSPEQVVRDGEQAREEMSHPGIARDSVLAAQCAGRGGCVWGPVRVGGSMFGPFPWTKCQHCGFARAHTPRLGSG